MQTDIDQRTGWPEELKTLLKRFPRDTWRSQGNSMTQFWLDKHDYFRQTSAQLGQAGVEFREGRLDATQFAGWIAPRLQSFLGALHGHHQVEDYHYFPAFREAEKSLAPGFDVLASDHELLHNGIVQIVEGANGFFDALQQQGAAAAETRKKAADVYLAASETAFRRLVRHLSDEEDLIIPIMLERH